MLGHGSGRPARRFCWHASRALQACSSQLVLLPSLLFASRTYVTTTLEKALNYAKKMPHAGCVFKLQVDLGNCKTLTRLVCAAFVYVLMYVREKQRCLLPP